MGNTSAGAFLSSAAGARCKHEPRLRPDILDLRALGGLRLPVKLLPLAPVTVEARSLLRKEGYGLLVLPQRR
jgi:hypothetical protein